MKIFTFLVLAIPLSFCWPVIANDNTVYQFSVKHDHFWGKGSGDLTIDQEGIAYTSEKDDNHSTDWSYSDIQELKIESPQKIHIRTYEDVWWKLNRDRTLEFELIEGKMSAEVVGFLRERLPNALVSTVFAPPDDAAYRVPVKHMHALGRGCEGQLLFSENGVYYNASNSDHSRFWPIEDIKSLGRMSRANIRITAPEHSHSGSIRNFQFQLKRPMDDETYELLWRTIYEPQSWLDKLGTDSSFTNAIVEEKK